MIFRVPPGPAVVVQDEVLDQIEQPLLGEHAVEQRLGVQARLLVLRIALPLDEVLPLAGDRAVASLVAVAHHQEGVVVEGLGDAVFGEVVGQVVVEAGADVPVDSLQLDEDQRQAAHEAHEIGAPVVVRHPHALDLQLPHGQEAVAKGVTEIDDLGVRVAGFAACVPPLDRHAAPDESVEFAVVLDERAGVVDPDELLDRLLARLGRKIGIQPRDGRPQVPHQHHLALGCPAKGAVRPEGLGVVGIDALPAENLLQVVGEGLLDQPVFAVDVGQGHGSWLSLGSALAHSPSVGSGIAPGETDR
jgi:hypothetical protein